MEFSNTLLNLIESMRSYSENEKQFFSSMFDSFKKHKADPYASLNYALRLNFLIDRSRKTKEKLNPEEMFYEEETTEPADYN